MITDRCSRLPRTGTAMAFTTSTFVIARKLTVTNCRLDDVKLLSAEAKPFYPLSVRQAFDMPPTEVHSACAFVLKKVHEKLLVVRDSQAVCCDVSRSNVSSLVLSPAASTQMYLLTLSNRSYAVH